MCDSDSEFEPLDPSNVQAQTIGEHELNTSPLVINDIIGSSRQFAQRGLMGTVLSVHGRGLPRKTGDPRIYMNLDAPSSGLVCGVQGSGKSHTVACILESSLISNRKVGTLTAPPATLVFHFDEENGERPCEAAYLSELKDGLGFGVEEVVVLVSPSNLQTRRRVYSGLKYVHVEPLRIMEGDLNASRMLSMMGAESLETLPLYMHTILSILRDMGSDNFNYREFRKRLKAPKFCGSQNAMLGLRLDLLDSFLKGDGPDVKSLFKPGRLVIIDISDPFVEPTTVAMLFDICLGLFIEGKFSSGKMIVLDEAHKYLTNVDANRFTKSICSIIRQQRHLSARVVISTQEPTVVPPSILGLLSWLVCHRFSSPGWVKHLRDHIYVEEEHETEGHPEWGKHVMRLRTGEAVLYSPGSLFSTEEGNAATLSSGYAIIKTRKRLTSDGGASLLATQAQAELSPETQAAPLTPPPSDTLPSPVFPSSPRMPSMIPPNRPIQPIAEPVASTPAIHAVGIGTAFASARQPSPSSVPVPNATPSLQPSPSPTLEKPVQIPATQPAATPSPPSIALSRNTLHSTYGFLVEVMNRLHHSGMDQPDLSKIGTEFAKSKEVHFTGRLKKYMEAAAKEGVVTMSGKGDDTAARLSPRFLAQTPIASLPLPATPRGASSTPYSSQIPATMLVATTALIAVIAMHAGNPRGSATVSTIGALLRKHKDGDFKKAGFKKLKDLVGYAEGRGLVAVTGDSKRDYLVNVL